MKIPQAAKVSMQETSERASPPCRIPVAGYVPVSLCNVSQGTHLTATLAPLFLRDWPASWTRKKPKSAQSGWFCQRDRSPISMISEAVPCSLRQRKSRHGRSLDGTLLHNTAN
jgi:hypothetical protein